MKDKFFIDTNIFVYSFDSTDPGKQETAHGLIKTALKHETGCISFQVMQEFLNVASKKFDPPLKLHDLPHYLTNFLVPLCQVYASAALYLKALEISERWQYSFYDSLIIGAALRAEASILFTEDLQHGQKIQSLSIVNPFFDSFQVRDPFNSV